MQAAPAKAILSVQEVAKGFGGQPVLQGVSLTLHEGDRVGLMGRNGVGKSTLLRIMAGAEIPDDGLVTRSQWLRVALLDQQCRLDLQKTVGGVLEEAAADARAMLDAYHRSTELLAASGPGTPEHRRLQAQCAQLHHRLDLAGAWNLAQELKRAAAVLQLPPDDRPLDTLSGGELRRVDLAATLVRHPDVLLLDEPTNQIDTSSVEWLEGFLGSFPGTCVLVTHDRYFLDRVVTRIVELESGRLRSFPGNYTRFLEYKSDLVEHDVRAEANRQGFLRRELAWLRRGPKARTSKDKKRIQRYRQVEARETSALDKEMMFEIPAPKRLGKRILEAHALTHGYGDKVLFRDFSFLMLKHMRVGVIGPNGCGKTTLLRLLMGLEQPDAGEVVVGDKTQFLYVDQTNEEVNLNHTILEHVSGGARYFPIGERKLYVPTYLERFLFDRNSCLMPMKNLSGGELNRIVLAKKLLRGGNLLVLDEPTNDLDLATLRVLEEAINAFEGCALIVSHDRYFINRVCTDLIVFQGDAQPLALAGNYDDYLAYKRRVAETAEAKTGRTRKPARKQRETHRPRSLTYKEKEELAHIEGDIEAAEADLRSLETRAASPDFYRQNAEAIRLALAELAQAKDKVDALFARWDELEGLRP